MRNRRRILRIERLESRQLLAGNVTVALDGDGNLRIRDDGEDNQIEITQDMLGNISVTGLTGTDINGVDEGTATFPAGSVTGGIGILMESGLDEVTVTDVDIVGGLSYSKTFGTTAFIVSGGSAGGDVHIEMGNGGVADFSNFDVTGNLKVNRPLGGADSLRVSGGTVGGDLTLWKEPSLPSPASRCSATSTSEPYPPQASTPWMRPPSAGIS